MSSQWVLLHVLEQLSRVDHLLKAVGKPLL